ncbi:MAG: hypothetical protein H3C47_03020 [Candidatus Cloacimonetes bacterium]|nr:hypothetical protein [Candidatus Cloacimonadota bacterium]
MSKIWFVFFVLVSPCYSLPELELPRLWNRPETWLGLGFFLSPSQDFKYQNCHLEAQHTFSLSESPNQLLIVHEVKNQTLILKQENQRMVYCRPDSSGMFPELVFYKDLLDAKSHLMNKTVFSRSGEALIKNKSGVLVPQKIDRFKEFLIRDINLHPASSVYSLIAELFGTDRQIVFIPFSVSGVNQSTPVASITNHLLLQSPIEKYSLVAEDWNNLRSGQVREGYSIELVELIRGKPMRRVENSEHTTLIYQNKASLLHHVFFKGRLLTVREEVSDEL